MANHRLNQPNRRAQIVAVVLEGLLDRLAHGLVRSEVHDLVDVVLGEHALNEFSVKQVTLDEHHLVGRQGPHCVDRFDRGVAEIIE